MIPFTTPAFAKMHPFAPVDQAQGYAEMMDVCALFLPPTPTS